MLALLRTTRGLVSGSAALLAISNLAFTPGDLDIYVPESQEDTAIQMSLKTLGFRVTQSKKPSYGNNTEIRTIHWLKNKKKRMNIMVVKGENALLALFQFHSTIVMNFLSADGLYCAYPSLTLSNLAIANIPIMIREGGISERCRDCFDKYRSRGIAFENDAQKFEGHSNHVCWVDAECPMTVRTSRDHRGLYIKLFSATQLETEIKGKHRAMVVWCLGGPIC
ncbi:hypothetical protein DFH06DRAFT_921721, partial [Mycena polygramma]